MVTDRVGCPVVCVELLNVSHGEVRLEADSFTEVHNCLVGLVYQEMYLEMLIVITIIIISRLTCPL